MKQNVKIMSVISVKRTVDNRVEIKGTELILVKQDGLSEKMAARLKLAKDNSIVTT